MRQRLAIRFNIPLPLTKRNTDDHFPKVKKCSHGLYAQKYSIPYQEYKIIKTLAIPIENILPIQILKRTRATKIHLWCYTHDKILTVTPLVFFVRQVLLKS